MSTEMERFFARAEVLLERLEKSLPGSASKPDWENIKAFRWRKQQHSGYFQPIAHPHRIRLEDLQGVDHQKSECDRNTRQFVQGLPANNILLSGSKGTGKSSIVKALLNEYASQGLRLVEVDKQELIDLPDIVEAFRGLPQRFIIFCDDLSFDADEPGYKAMKSALDGAVGAPPDNVLIYATSNRRHLMPEYMSENLEARHVDGELHPGETSEEKISLSERFGLWLSFYAFKQDEYLEIADYWLKHFGMPGISDTAARTAALQWALTRGSRSGRAAWQFARDWAGQQGLQT